MVKNIWIVEQREPDTEMGLRYHPFSQPAEKRAKENLIQKQQLTKDTG